MSVYRVHPRDDEDYAPSDAAVSDDSLILTSADSAIALNTTIGGRESDLDSANVSGNGKATHDDNSRMGMQLARDTRPIVVNGFYRPCVPPNVFDEDVKAALASARVQGCLNIE